MNAIQKWQIDLMAATAGALVLAGNVGLSASPPY